MKEICKRFKQVRKNAGLTQPEYAKMLNITRSAVNAIENERYLPSIEMLQILHKKFKVSYNWLIDGR
jgi:DNA-binding XRE family transcriptional regulator